MIPCEDDKHMVSQRFKVTVDLEKSDQGRKVEKVKDNQGILLTMNRLLFGIHLLYKNEIILQGAQIKPILHKHAVFDI